VRINPNDLTNGPRAAGIENRGRRTENLGVVEVKVRASAKHATFAVTRHQQHRIARVAEHFLSITPGYTVFQLRFNAILAVPDAWRIN
jgi:Holliday junction resolvase-like predicted endonuclease